MLALFRDRKSAREHIKSKYGYILRRTDLLAEPHGWMLPVAVRVEVRVKPNVKNQAREPQTPNATAAP